MNTEIKKIVIVSGQWSTNGNFSGYDILGTERYHIQARLMESLGYKKGGERETVTFPLFATVVNKSFTARVDADGNKIPNADGTFGVTDRPTVTSLFKTERDGIDAFVGATNYSRNINIALMNADSIAGVSAASIAALEALAP